MLTLYLNKHYKLILFLIILTIIFYRSPHILLNGRFVAEEPGNYSISATLGDITSSKPLRVVARDIKREVYRVLIKALWAKRGTR